MPYSRQLKALNTRDAMAAVNQLLGQLNLVQSESERQFESLKLEIRELKARVRALEGK